MLSIIIDTTKNSRVTESHRAVLKLSILTDAQLFHCMRFPPSENRESTPDMPSNTKSTQARVPKDLRPSVQLVLHLDRSADKSTELG